MQTNLSILSSTFWEEMYTCLKDNEMFVALFKKKKRKKKFQKNGGDQAEKME